MAEQTFPQVCQPFEGYREAGSIGCSATHGRTHFYWFRNSALNLDGRKAVSVQNCDKPENYGERETNISPGAVPDDDEVIAFFTMFYLKPFSSCFGKSLGRMQKSDKLWHLDGTTRE